MLHFIIGTALCIWIAERVWHYCSEWRWRRQQRRYVRWLQGEDIRSGLPPWVTPSPLPQSKPAHSTETIVTVSMCVGFIGVILLMQVFR